VIKSVFHVNINVTDFERPIAQPPAPADPLAQLLVTDWPTLWGDPTDKTCDWGGCDKPAHG
jgi:hypothetical protein